MVSRPDWVGNGLKKLSAKEKNYTRHRTAPLRRKQGVVGEGRRRTRCCPPRGRGPPRRAAAGGGERPAGSCEFETGAPRQAQGGGGGRGAPAVGSRCRAASHCPGERLRAGGGMGGCGRALCAALAGARSAASARTRARRREARRGAPIGARALPVVAHAVTRTEHSLLPRLRAGRRVRAVSRAPESGPGSHPGHSAARQDGAALRWRVGPDRLLERRRPGACSGNGV
jgi:hypothetical protein